MISWDSNRASHSFDAGSQVAVFVEVANEVSGYIPEHYHTGVVFWSESRMQTIKLEQGWHHKTFAAAFVPPADGHRIAFTYPVVDVDSKPVLLGICDGVADDIINGDATYAYSLLLDSRVDFRLDISSLLEFPGIGFTCVTLVIALFRSAGVTVVDHNTWHLRKRDIDYHGSLWRLLCRTGCNQKHAQAVQNQIESPRVRPEELGAACLFDQPADMLSAIIASAEIDRHCGFSSEPTPAQTASGVKLDGIEATVHILECHAQGSLVGLELELRIEIDTELAPSGLQEIDVSMICSVREAAEFRDTLVAPRVAIQNGEERFAAISRFPISSRDGLAFAVTSEALRLSARFEVQHIPAHSKPPV